MTVLIIEDEEHTALRLKSLILKYDKNIEVIAVLNSISESIKWFKNHKQPELIFQDIQLSDGSCFEIYNSVKIASPVIFTTAYSKYALKSFEVNSIDYLVKPYDFSDIKRVLDKFFQFSSLFQLPDLSDLKELILSKSIAPKRRFLVRLGDKFKTINATEIAYIHYDDGITFAYVFLGSKYPLDQTITELESTLDPHDFYRINRKYIINNQSIQKISTWFSGRLKLELKPKPDKDIIVSRERVKGFKQWLGG